MKQEFDLERISRAIGKELKSKDISDIGFEHIERGTKANGTEGILVKITLKVEIDPSKTKDFKQLFAMEKGAFIGLILGDPSQTSLLDHE